MFSDSAGGITQMIFIRLSKEPKMIEITLSLIKNTLI